MKHLELMTAIASHLPEWEVESEQHRNGTISDFYRVPVNSSGPST